MESQAIRRASDAEPSLPTGTVTFVFSDIEGSTTRWERFPDAMRDAVRAHDAIMRASIAAHGGRVFKTIGDAFCAAYARPEDAAAGALEAQRALAASDFAAVDGLRVRMAIHLGSADERDGDYFGPPLNRVARLVSVGHGGQIVLSGVAAEMLRGTLAPDVALRDLGEHRLKDLAQPEHVFQLAAADLPAEFPPLRSLSVLRNNLSLYLTPLLGRDETVRDVVALLAGERLVTLLGPGGIGKTRIAQQAAADLLEALPDGAWFVDLAPLASDAFVADAIGSVLSVAPAVGRTTTETLVRHLRASTMLLVIDNCEHLIAGVASVVETILRAAPNVTVLTTTREPLRLSGERVVRIASLDVPPPDATLRAADATRYGAIALFVARANAADARFALTDETAPIVGDIVRRLDGIALAIELAAARVTVLSVATLARRLDERFRVLTGGNRTALPRQRTMRALMDWSWDLLSERDRTLLRRVGLFAGGWTLEAAESVCADDAFDALDVLDASGSLVDKSLIATDFDAREPRNRLLETTRAYVLEKLDESGERDGIALRHATWVAAFCDRMHAAYDGSPAWLAEIESELDNARAALAWSIANGRSDLAARIVLRGLCGYWWFRAPREGLAWTERVLAALDHDAEPVLAGALYGVAGSYTPGRRGTAAYARSVEILTPLAGAGVPLAPYARLSYSLGGLGYALLLEGRTREAREVSERNLRAYVGDGGEKSLGYANELANYATVLAKDGDLAAARETFARARAAFTARDEEPGIATVAQSQAQAEFAAGDVRAARAYALEAAAIDEKFDLPVGLAETLADVAACDYLEGDVALARERTNAVVARAVRARIEIPAAALLIAAVFASDAGDDARAARLVGFVEGVERREERTLDAISAALRERLVARFLAKPEVDALRRASEAAAALDASEIADLARGALAASIETA